MRLRTLLAVIMMAAASALYGAIAVAQPAAGSQVCAACHQDYVNSFLAGPHAVKGNKGTPAAIGAECSACHGDVSAHLKDPTTAKPMRFGNRVNATAESAVCLTCHQAEPPADLLGFRQACVKRGQLQLVP